MEERKYRNWLVLLGILFVAAACKKSSDVATTATSPTTTTAVEDAADSGDSSDAASDASADAEQEEEEPATPTPSPSPSPVIVPAGSGVNGYSLGAPSDITYADISGGTVAVLSDQDDGNVYVSLGFSFPYWGNVYTEVALESNGRLSFVSPQASFFSDYSNNSFPTMADIPNTSPLNSIYFWWDDLYATAGTVTYSTSGSEGSHIFTVQYKDLQRFGFSTSLINAQVRLSEHDHTIEISYGAGTNLSNFSATTGIRGSIDGAAIQSVEMLVCNPVCAGEFPVNKKYIFTPNAD